MRICDYTKWAVINGNAYIYHLVHGTLSEIPLDLLDYFEKLREKGSFSQAEWEYSLSILENSTQQGYITCYGPKEAEREYSKIIEKRKDNVLMGKKNVVLVLEKKYADRLCWRKKDEPEKKTREDIVTTFDKEKLVSLARQLKKTKMSTLSVLSGDEANACLGGLIRTLKEEGISLKKVISVSALDGYMVDEYIFSSEMIQNFDIFKRTWVAFCPFIYKTVFIDLNGGMDFCPLCLGKRNIYGFHLPEYKPKGNWNKMVFKNINSDVEQLKKGYYSQTCWKNNFNNKVEEIVEKLILRNLKKYVEV